MFRIPEQPVLKILLSLTNNVQHQSSTLESTFEAYQSSGSSSASIPLTSSVSVWLDTKPPICVGVVAEFSLQSRRNQNPRDGLEKNERIGLFRYMLILSMYAATEIQADYIPGNGCTVEAVRHCVYSLRRLLSPNYAVISVEGKAIIEEPWSSTCALLVFPGGADLGYCRTLNGEGNRRISQYVERGGSYLGFCAGAYYASARCEFEAGNKQLEVVGDRELAFYPGVCRGLAFPGFVYHSEAGAKAVELTVNKNSLTKGSVPDVFRSYYNGGGVFVDAPSYKDKGVEVLASYTEELKVDAGEGTAAVVYCKVGEGAAVLTCPHPEYIWPRSIMEVS